MKVKESIDLSKQFLPDVEDREVAPFFEGTQESEIRFPRCRNCNRFQWYPTVLCPSCQSPDFEWQVLTSQPRVYTWSVVRWNLAPPSLSHVYDIQGPYIVALVEFDEAPDNYLATNLIDCQPEEVYIGMPLEVVFQQVNDKTTMPLFRPKETNRRSLMLDRRENE